MRMHAIFFGELFEPGRGRRLRRPGELQLGPAGKQAWERSDERVHTFVAFAGEPAADGEDDAAGWKTGRRRSFGCDGKEGFEFGIEGPGKNADALGFYFLVSDDVFRGALAGSENQIGATERTAAHGGERLPDFDAVSADNCFHARGGEAHGLRDGREIGMRGEDQLGVTAGAAHGGGDETAFGALAAGENKFAAAYGHAMEFRRIIEAEQAAFHGAAGGEFGEHGGEMAAGTLDAAGSVEFRKYADEHLGESAKRRDGTQAGEAQWGMGASRVHGGEGG